MKKQIFLFLVLIGLTSTCFGYKITLENTTPLTWPEKTKC